MKRLTAIKHVLLLVNNHQGSGIDSNWSIVENSRSIVATNSYHCMNDNGYYDGWVDFKVIVPKSNPTKWRVILDGSYLSKKYQLLEYLEDIFGWELSNYEVSLMQSKLDLKNCYYLNKPTFKTL